MRLPALFTSRARHAAVLLLAGATTGVQPAARQTPPSPLAAMLPAGEGKALLERVCAGCHDPSLVMFTREDEEGWAVIVNDMAARGAKGTKEELDGITSYLATHFSRTKGFTPLLPGGTGGREIYLAICATCHQADGRGRQYVAPTLVGSGFVTGNAGTPIRIMLHGKRGAANVMPAMGRFMTDEQIAAVLTYVRREWGNTAPPVDEADVTAIRRSTEGRSRPWTAEELEKGFQ